MSYLTRRIAVQIVLLAVSAFFTHQSAFAFTSGDFEYDLDYSNMTAAVAKYKGSASSVSIPSLIDVPEQYKDEDGEWHTRYKVFTVIGIGESAFQGNATITSVELPSSVWYTSTCSFADCTSLISFPFDRITSYGKFSFKNCSALKSVVTSSHTTYYGLGVFQGCTSLKSAEINGNGNCIISTHDDDGFFTGCSSLEVCRLGGGVKEITCSGIWGYRNPSAMFSGCDSLREVYFDGLEELGNCSLRGKTSLEVCCFPSATRISDDMFRDCSNLTEITPLDNITSIGANAFKGCSSLPGAIELSALESIGVYAFSDCVSITSVCTSCKMGYYPGCIFKGCSGLVSVEINGNGNCTIEGGYSWEGGFFAGCTALEVCRLGVGVTRITSGSYGGGPDAMFSGCDSLREVYFDGLTELFHGSLRYCKSLKKCLFPNATIIGNDMFRDCSNLTEITPLDNITSIGANAFKGCSSLPGAIELSALESIGVYAFSDCVSITSVCTSSKVGYYPGCIFKGCSGLVSAEINGNGNCTIEGGRSWDGGFFAGCTALEICRLGVGVTHITSGSYGGGPNAMFSGCDSLREVYFDGLTELFHGSLRYCNSLKKCLFSNATIIGNDMFRDCSNLTEITPLDKIATIGDYAFQGCAKLTSMSFSPNLTYIGNRAFYGCLELGQCCFYGAPPNTHNDAFLSIKSGAVGYYTAEQEKEWNSVIPSSGLWRRLIMRPAKQPKLEIKSVDWINGSIQLDWSNTENCEEVNWPCTLYRGTTENFADAKPIANNLTETTYSDVEFLTAEPVTAPLYYWIVPENGDISCVASLPIVTRRRYGLFVGVESFENGWKDDFSYFKNDTEAVRDLFVRFRYIYNNSLTIPSSRDLSRAITDLAANCHKGDMAAIWIFTHGGSTRKKSELSNGISWLCMSPKNDRYFSEQMALDLATFDKDVVVTPIIYACHAGGMIESSQGIIDALGAEDYITSASMQCGASIGFVASISKDISYPVTNTHGKESPFVRFMIDGATNASDNDFDGRLSMDELFDYVAMQQQRFVPVAEVQKPNELILQRVLLEESYKANASGVGSKPQAPTNLRAIQNSADGSVFVEWDAAVGAKWYSIQCTAMNSDGEREILRCDLTYDLSRFFSANMLKLTNDQLTYSDYIFNVCSGNEFGKSEVIQIGYTPPSTCIIVNVKASNDQMGKITVSWDVTGLQNIDSFTITRRQMSWGGIGVDAGATSFFDYILEANIEPTELYYIDKTAYMGDMFAMFQYKVEAIRDGEVVASKYSPYTTCQRSPTLKVDEVAPISCKPQIYHLDVDSNTKITWHYDDVEFCTRLGVFTNGTTKSFYFAFKENLSEESRPFRFQVWAWVDDEVVLHEERVIVQLGASHLDSDNDQNCIPSNRTLLRLLEDDGIVIDAGQIVEVVDGTGDTGAEPELSLSGEGMVEFSNKSAAPSFNVCFAEDWTGTLVMDWVTTAEESKGYDFNKWGIAGAYVEIASPFVGYPFQSAVIQPTLVLSSGLTINDGWRDTTTTFYGITGSGDFTASGRGDVGDRYFHINTISNYTGTLSSGSWGNGVFEIDDIQTDVSSEFRQRIVKGGETLKVRNISATTLNGSDANLCVDAVNGELGIYVAAAETVTDDGTRTGYATIDNALSAADGAGICTVVVYDTDSATNDKTGWILENGVYESTRQIASVGDNFYPSLNRAIRAAMASGTNEVVLLVDTADAINEADWTGTVVIPWDKANTGFPFDKYGNDNSTIEISGTITGWPGEAKSVLQEVRSRVKVTGSLGIINGSSRARCVFDEIAGDGILVFNTDKLYAIDRLSDWDGALTIVNQNTMLMNVVSGAGTIESFAKPQYVPNFGSGWHGTYVVGFDLADEDACLLPGKYGVTGSTVVIAQPIANGYFMSYSGEDSLFIEPNLYLKADVTITDGFSDAHNVTTFPQIGSDSGVKFSTRAGNSRGTYYLFKKLRDFNGTLVVSDYSKVTIGEIATDRIPLIGERILNVQRSEVGAEIIDLPKTKLSVNGVLKEVELELMDDGIYVAGYGEHYPLFDIGEKGIITSGGGTYNVVAADGEVLEDGDFSFAVAREAYSINISGDGKSATIALNPPMVNMVAPEDETDTNDPSGMLVVVDEGKISSKPVPNEGEEVGALPVNAYKGLFYQIGWGSDLNNLIYGDKVQAVGGSLYLGVIKQRGERGFYKVTVSEK